MSLGPKPSWVDTPVLYPMVDITDPRCDAYPPPYTAEPVKPQWEGGYTGTICTTYNTSYTYPCCQFLSGTARTWCGRVQCSLDKAGLDEWGTCVQQLMAETGGEAVGLACTPSSLDVAPASNSSSKSSGTPKFSRAVGVGGVVLIAMAVLQLV